MNKTSLPSTRVKICGLTRNEDANLAAKLGAWALGFIFYQKSPRFIEAQKVAEILAQLTSPVSKVVGVFVNPTIDELKNTIAESGVNTIQLHGNESGEFCSQVRKLFPKHEIIKAIRMDQSSGDENSGSISHSSLPYHYQLVDSITDRDWGGTGKTVDWEKAAKLTGLPLILAGGLTAENVASAISIVEPYAIDLSSGVESSPGLKSPEKLKALFEAVQRQDLELYE